MWLHCTDTSNDRGQYGALAEALHTAHLVSYHYRREALKYFEPLWRLLVHVHLTTTHDGPIAYDALRTRGHLASLLSYAYAHAGCAKKWETHWAQMITDAAPSRRPARMRAQVPDLRPRVIVDSGAFTAWTTGQAINLEEYATWGLAFRERWADQFASLVFLTLDVIGDQDATWVNTGRIQRLGLPVIPIVTFNAPLTHVDRALDEGPYLALGGLVPYLKRARRAQLRWWLDRCFGRVIAHRERTGTMPRVHLLGVTTRWVVERYPCYSTDSSSWVAPLIYGRGSAAGLDSVPRLKDASTGDRAAVLHALRHEIRIIQRLQSEATALWAHRGVTFDDHVARRR